jgi:hypothetical protein
VSEQAILFVAPADRPLPRSTNTHIPSPPWAAVSPVLIPFKTCNKAADTLISWFSSPEEVKAILGGERWWQIRGLDGLEAEWVTMRSFLKEGDLQEKAEEKRKKRMQKLSDTETDILAMENLETVMVRSTLDHIRKYVLILLPQVLYPWWYASLELLLEFSLT